MIPINTEVGHRLWEKAPVRPALFTNNLSVRLGEAIVDLPVCCAQNSVSGIGAREHARNNNELDREGEHEGECEQNHPDSSSGGRVSEMDVSRNETAPLRRLFHSCVPFKASTSAFMDLHHCRARLPGLALARRAVSFVRSLRRSTPWWRV